MARKPSPYAAEIDALLAKAREEQDRTIKIAKEKRHYACVLVLYRKRMQWSDFQKQMVEFTTRYFLRKYDFHDSIYYNSYEIHLTQDYTMAQMFSLEHGIVISRSLPFETEINLKQVTKEWKETEQ